MSNNYEEITGDGPTLQILDNIRKNHTLIHVRIQENSNPWTSAIIAVNLAGRTWRFDELASAEGHRQLLKERHCAIETRMNGVLVKFKAEVTDSGADEKGLIYYQAPPPRSVFVYQRRGDFRVPLSASQRAIIRFFVPDVGPIRGTIRDISLGGIGINLSTWIPAIQSGLYISNCTITFPDEKTITCDLSICFVRRSIFGTSIGARFMNISRDNQKQITKFVMFLDRERAKRSNRFDI